MGPVRDYFQQKQVFLCLQKRLVASATSNAGFSHAVSQGRKVLGQLSNWTYRKDTTCQSLCYLSLDPGLLSTARHAFSAFFTEDSLY